MQLNREISAPGVALRPETQADAAFLHTLFAACTRDVLAAAGLPEAAVAELVEMQHRGRSQAYATLHPAARGWIILQAGAAVGRLLEADVGSGAYVVDVAVLPSRRRQGLGRAALTWLMGQQAHRGGGVSAQVAVGNLASRAMFAALGFVESGTAHCAHVDVLWRGGRPGVAPAQP